MRRQHRWTGRSSLVTETDSPVGGASRSPTVVIKMTILKTHSVWQCTYTSEHLIQPGRGQVCPSVRRVLHLCFVVSVAFIMAFEDRSSPSAANESIQSTTTPNSPESSRTSPYTCTTIQSPGVVEEKPFFRITSFALNGRQTDDTKRSSPNLVIPYHQGFRIASPSGGLSSPRSPSDSVRSFDTSSCSTPPPASNETKCTGMQKLLIIISQSNNVSTTYNNWLFTKKTISTNDFM